VEDAAMISVSHPTWLRTVSLVALALAACAGVRTYGQEVKAPASIKLPAARTKGKVSVEEALQKRHALRSFTAAPLTLAQVGQMLWAGQGVTDARGRRTAPSARGLYPLELLLVAGEVTGLPAGVYRYRPAEHALVPIADGDRRQQVADACALRDHAKVPVMIVLTAVEGRSATVYGPRAPRMVAFEAGAATENMLLEADALGLGCGAAVEFDASGVASAVGLAPDETPKVVFTLAKP
jgi:SagB-type dehydrogenase family enzyme